MKGQLLFVIIQQTRFFLFKPSGPTDFNPCVSWRALVKGKEYPSPDPNAGVKGERQKAGADPRGSLTEGKGTVSPGHISPAAWCSRFLGHSCALTSLLGVTEHRRGASAAMRSTNESFLTRCRSCVTSPNGWGVTPRPSWSICCTKSECRTSVSTEGEEWTKHLPHTPSLSTTHCGLSGGVTLRCSGFFCLLKSARDNQEYCTRTDPCHMLGIISKE